MEASEHQSSDQPADSQGKITTADIERARRQIGVPKFSYNKPYHSITSTDSLSHFAWACGDDNPLWHDRTYGQKRAGGIRLRFHNFCTPRALI